MNRHGRERYSLPFFLDPPFNLEVAPLPECVSPERPAAYEPLTMGRHIMAKYADTHAGYGGGAAAAAATGTTAAGSDQR